MATTRRNSRSIQAESTVDDSIIALLTGIKAQLDAVLAGGLTLKHKPSGCHLAAAQTNSSKVAAAVTANTPAAPTPPTP